MTVTPSFRDIQSAAIEAVLRELHTCMPAEILRIHSGDHGLQFVDVLPSLQRQVPNEEGELIDESLPLIPMVPVGYPQGGGFFISVPLAVGDIVLLVFAERSLDQWIETARKASKRTVNPGDTGTHTLDGAIALPCGPAPRGELLEGVSAANLVIGKVGAGPAGQIQITAAGQIQLAGSTDFVALAAKVATELARVNDDIAALKAAVSTGLGGVPSAGAGLKTAFDSDTAAVPSSPASVAAANVKAT